MDDIAAKVAQVPGVVGVMLGGSRARGAHRPDSDWDLGVYYRGAPDLAALEALAAEATGGPVEVYGPGSWGAWVNGGAWLVLPDGRQVDWILRDVDRVRRVWDECREGRFEIGVQAGHPLGFWSPAYPGEVALGRVLADTGGELDRLRQETRSYPEALRKALTRDGVWDAGFSVAMAGKSSAARDVLHVTLCLSRAVGYLVQALHAHHRRWCLNEKGALAAASAMPETPPGFGDRASVLLGGIGHGGRELKRSLEAAAELVDEVRGVVGDLTLADMG
ncbi:MULTISPECIES: nucleotidyltransferase domain-containing protein [unclassified Streptomyces]|uniref:nucleotidyltransferase domain-containing protein n=1 Tax=unclassified Streptomyces TaxID=2593676 RepID=UPI0008917054|nr:MULTISPECIES: nucleotidyltransferase domain-containing protein [unclassified Streptomyces]SDQ96720.1 Nucleotidyltransferase domain-containing protein [Streptomyces sp. KS_16]